MRVLRTFLVLGAFVALTGGCGGGGGAGLAGGDIAVVGEVHVTQAQFDAAIQQSKRNFQQTGRPFPKAGSQEYASLKNDTVRLLVQLAEREVRAQQMGIVVTDKQVEARLKQIKNQYFQGSDKKYEAQLKKQGLTDEQVRADLKSTMIGERIFDKVTGGVTVSADEVHQYYLQHPQLYARPQSRDVRHILVGTSSGRTATAAKTLADKIYAQLKGGADFAKLAKKYSDDPGSKDTGGKLTVSRGQTVPQFDAKVFTLKTKEISKPVKTQYGWHIIQALGPIKPPATTPEAQVKDSIKEQLLSTKRNEKMTAWIRETDKKLKSKVKYKAGFKPPPEQQPTTTG